MKGWVGTCIAIVALLIALFFDPEHLLSSENLVVGRVSLVTALLSAICAAFLLGQSTSELSFSKHTATWSAGLALVTIGALNIDLLVKKAPLSPTMAKSDQIIIIKKKPKKRQSAAIYHPDTLKINRVEKIVKRSELDPRGNHQKEEILVTNQLSKKNSTLDKGWQPSEEDKQRFKKFLKQQGLKYDPETAFKLPAPE